MSVRCRLVAAAVATTALAGAVAVVSTAGAQGASTQFFTWFGTPNGAGSYFSVVFDSKANPSETSIVERDATTGGVLSQFGSGYVAAGITATPDGRVYVSVNDGTVRVYAQPSGRYRQVDIWTLDVPGPPADPVVGGPIVRAQGGYTLVAVTRQPPGFVPPSWLGVVVLDRDGNTVASWPTPAESVPPNAFVLPIALSRTRAGEIFVNGIPCQAGLCGSPVQPIGYLYQLALSNGPAGPAPTLVQTGRWASDRLPDVSSAAAVDGTHIVAVGGGAGDASPASAELPSGRSFGASVGLGSRFAEEYELSGDGTLARVALLRGILNPNTVSTDLTRKGATVYMTENSAASRVIVERFTKPGSSWKRQGRPWNASWGPDGPRIVRCAGRAATIVGTNGPDVINGTNGPDVIAALGGADVVRGFGGDDTICLGNGADQANAGSGDDLILGEAGPDRIVGADGLDILGGGLGADIIEGRAGDDRMRGQLGRDLLLGGRGVDVAHGGPGNDACSAETTTSC